MAIKYDIKTASLKRKCKKCFEKISHIFGVEAFSQFVGFKEDGDLDNIAAYFTNDGLGYPAGYVVVKNDNIQEWTIQHELAHALENSAFGDGFEDGSAKVLDMLGEKPKREAEYIKAECLADYIADNIDDEKITEVAKCLNEAI